MKMTPSVTKRATDIAAIATVLLLIVTGLALHAQVHHLHVYDSIALWTLHETAGLCLAVLIVCHCLQHCFWFKAYAKLPVGKRRVTTLLLIVAFLVVASGVVLMSGSHSQVVSIFHYVVGILFTLLAVGHVARRRKIFRALFGAKHAS